MKKELDVASADEMEKLGQRLGRLLQGGEVIELISDLGGGKTTLTRGIAAGAGSQDLVSSPTFTISNLYQADKFDIHHFDFYRLAEAGLMEHELAEVVGDPKAVVVVEWSSVVSHVLPKDRLTVRIQTVTDGERHLLLESHGKADQILEKL